MCVLDKVGLSEMILIKMSFRQHRGLGMIVGFSKVEGISD
jgi:hypothetical protein